MRERQKKSKEEINRNKGKIQKIREKEQLKGKINARREELKKNLGRM